MLVYNVHFIRGNEQQRKKEIEEFVCNQLKEVAKPILVAGDFNTTSQTVIYRTLKKHLNNSHDDIGSGLGFTFPAAPLPMIFDLNVPAIVRIDHIFFSSYFKAISAKTLQRSGGSDHYPVFAELVPVSPSHGPFSNSCLSTGTYNN